MAKYNVYSGLFLCHICKKEVHSIRSYPTLKKLTWMCPERHVSEVNLNTKKSKKDYEREERE
jgi:hypothetical protein